MAVPMRKKSKPQPAALLAPREKRAPRASPLRDGGEGACPEHGEGSPRSGGEPVPSVARDEVSRDKRSAAPKAASQRGSIELARLDQVRAEAARLYNRCAKAYGREPSPMQARVLLHALGLVRTAVADVELVDRMRKIEDEHARLRGAQAAPGGIGPASDAAAIN